MRLSLKTTLGTVACIAVALAAYVTYESGEGNPFLGLVIVGACTAGVTAVQAAESIRECRADRQSVTVRRRPTVILEACGIAMLIVGLADSAFVLTYGLIVGGPRFPADYAGNGCLKTVWSQSKRGSLMNIRRAIAVIAVLSSLCLAARAQDHLEPEEGALNTDDDEWSYAEKLRALLLKDASPYYRARLICLPSFQPEWAVTLVRDDEGFLTPDGQLAYFVEFAAAEKSVSEAKDFRQVSVKKLRVKIDGETAEAVHEVWRRMLRGVRYPKEPRLGLDGETYHMSRRVPMIDRGRPDQLGGFEDGQIWSPNEGSLTDELVMIGEALKKFALAKPEEKDKIRSEIRGKVERMRAKLNRAAQP